MKLTFQEVLQRASLFLKEHNREEKVAELLLMYHAGFTKLDLIMHERDVVTESIYQAFHADLNQHVKTGIPIQHLTGKEFFYGRSYTVNSHVLIPRPETEELVQAILQTAPTTHTPMHLIDVGTGSGVIAITLKLENPSLDVAACDISPEALTVAEQNAVNLGADVQFFSSDFLDRWVYQREQVEIIVANPPYISWADEPSLSDTVKNFDPQLALFAKENGLAAYMKIVEQAKVVLKPGGLLFFEIGYQQADAVSNLIKQHFPNSKIEVKQDLNKKDRIIIAKC
ncbi:release factor glutamine methyltransferase [Amphibacillus marinus]|uniref:Release factor glutamine methyltransferase n=1 Tax=Amphibacillus marinus TaxID=872970 RepID=A0A1H8N0F0_9BACI|nr:peptide chain release factor N(5)-glutamine methyltransferase [Amphibacillus marinus]SEO23044.1 release factor glutamine methyltransferase [Amphibacillus marinus]